MRVYTVGHGTRSLEEIVALLGEFSVDLLVDVRRHPGSRRHPHTNRTVLAEALPARGVAYEWWGEELGGRRSPEPDSPNGGWREPAFRGFADYTATPAFQTSLGGLADRATGGSTIALMCAETLWWRCHRRLIADALSARGMEVLHVLGPAKCDPHSVPEFAVVDAGGRVTYPPGQLSLTDGHEGRGRPNQ